MYRATRNIELEIGNFKLPVCADAVAGMLTASTAEERSGGESHSGRASRPRFQTPEQEEVRHASLYFVPESAVSSVWGVYCVRGHSVASWVIEGWLILCIKLSMCLCFPATLC